MRAPCGEAQSGGMMHDTIRGGMIASLDAMRPQKRPTQTGDCAAYHCRRLETWRFLETSSSLDERGGVGWEQDKDKGG